MEQTRTEVEVTVARVNYSVVVFRCDVSPFTNYSTNLVQLLFIGTVQETELDVAA